jgi:PBP1b-binding outer membrane lipoprotein LpoB
MMKTWIICLAAALLVAGCATPSKVQEMIEANNQQLASEQLKPEFNRINQELEDTLAKAEALTALIEELKAECSADKELTSSRIQSLSLALNKAQGDMGLFQEKMVEVGNICSMQRDEINETRSAVDRQKDALLAVFRKQQEDLSGVIALLEGALKTEEKAAELKAPVPTE